MAARRSAKALDRFLFLSLLFQSIDNMSALIDEDGDLEPIPTYDPMYGLATADHCNDVC